MDEDNVSPQTSSAEARNKRKLTCKKKGNISKRPTRSKPLSDITSSTLNSQINPTNTANISSVANQTQFSQLDHHIQHPPTYGRRCVPGLNLIAKFDATLQPGSTAHQNNNFANKNVANKRKTPDISYVHNTPSSSITTINNQTFPTSIAKSTASKPLADRTSSTFNTQINPTSSQNFVPIPYVGRTSLHGSNLLHQFDAVVQPGQTGSQIPNVASMEKTPDNRNGDHLPSPSMKQLNKRILPASLTKPTYQNQQTFHKSALNNPPKTPATQNNSTIITQPFPIKSSTSNVETILIASQGDSYVETAEMPTQKTLFLLLSHYIISTAQWFITLQPHSWLQTRPITSQLHIQPEVILMCLIM
jgi:hypothetical protein